MSSWFKLTKDGSLDRKFLRASAVYRCMKRYGAEREWCVIKLSDVMTPLEARTLYESWRNPREYGA